jgi:hypothetical protein
MGDAAPTKEQLIQELAALRLRIAELESPEGQRNTAEESQGGSGLPWPKVEHELRNLLAIMASLVDLLGRSVADPTARRQLDLLNTAIRSGAELLDRAGGSSDC